MSWVNRGDDFFGAGTATVWLSSASDPRWNWSARVVSIWGDDIERAVARLTAQYGDPPEDLEYGGMKD